MSEGYQPISNIKDKGDKYISVNGDYQKCTVDPNQTPIHRKPIEGNMLTLYTCKLEQEIIDQSGFWIHQDCLEDGKIKVDTFPGDDKRRQVNGQNYTEKNSKGNYKLVSVDGGVKRTEFLKRLSDIYQKVETSEQTVTMNGVQKMLQDARGKRDIELLKRLMKIGQRGDISKVNDPQATYEQLNKGDFVIVIKDDTLIYGLISEKNDQEVKVFISQSSDIVSILKSEVENKIFITENSPPAQPPAASAEAKAQPPSPPAQPPQPGFNPFF